MSRISIDVTDHEHKSLKAMAALRGQSIKDYVLERTLGENNENNEALLELEKLLDSRIRSSKQKGVSRKTASQIFAEAARRRAK